MAKKVQTSKKESKKTESDFFNDLMKKAGVEIPVVAKIDQLAITNFYSTGSLLLNGLISGSMNGGIAGNKVSAFAGEESTGKTFIALQIVKNFLDSNPTGHVFIFDSEDDPMKSRETLSDRGIDTTRTHVQRVKTIQEFRTSVIKLINPYLAIPEEKRQPMFLVLDSLGNLSTTKEMNDTAKGAVNKKTGDDTRDMTRAPLIRGFFRVLTIKLGMAGVAMLMTNHTYATLEAYGVARAMSGGGGLRFCASTIIFLYRKALRDEDDKKNVLGSILTADTYKSRFTRYGKQVEILLNHDYGLNKYWGLFEFGKENELLIAGTGEKGNKIKVNDYRFPDGQEATKKQINANPSKYFDTPENFAAFEELCNKTFRFGKEEMSPSENIDETNDDDVVDDNFEEDAFVNEEKNL